MVRCFFFFLFFNLIANFADVLEEIFQVANLGEAFPKQILFDELALACWIAQPAEQRSRGAVTGCPGPSLRGWGTALGPPHLPLLCLGSAFVFKSLVPSQVVDNGSWMSLYITMLFNVRPLLTLHCVGMLSCVGSDLGITEFEEIVFISSVD